MPQRPTRPRPPRCSHIVPPPPSLPHTAAANSHCCSSSPHRLMTPLPTLAAEAAAAAASRKRLVLQQQPLPPHAAPSADQRRCNSWVRRRLTPLLPTHAATAGSCYMPQNTFIAKKAAPQLGRADLSCLTAAPSQLKPTLGMKLCRCTRHPNIQKLGNVVSKQILNAWKQIQQSENVHEKTRLTIVEPALQSEQAKTSARKPAHKAGGYGGKMSTQPVGRELAGILAPLEDRPDASAPQDACPAGSISE